jgi:4-amino-4-deoxy-L-arabinose transferase-like glycosyltransferase
MQTTHWQRDLVEPNLTTRLPTKASSQSDYVCTSVLVGILVTLMSIWFAFDCRIPSQDEGVHILNSMAAAQHLSHCRPWQYQWWCHDFIEGEMYTPFIYLVNGLFILLFGQNRLVEQICSTFFCAVLGASLYAVVRFIKGGRSAALSAVLFLFAYPLVSWSGHTYFLDLPATGAMTLALAAFLWSRSGLHPAWFKASVAGVIAAFACLSRPTVVAYMISIAAYFLLADAFGAVSNRGDPSNGSRRKQLIHTIGMIAIVSLLALPYYISKLSIYEGWSAANMRAFSSIGVHHTYAGNLAAYLASLPTVLTLPLFGVFVASLLVFRLPEYRRLLPVIIATTGGACLNCASMGTDHDARYFMPFLICPAVFSGVLVEKLMGSANRAGTAIAFGCLALAVATYISFNFLPYPINLSPLPWASGLGREWRGNPVQHGYADWGYPSVIDTINKAEAGRVRPPAPIYLSVLPNHESLHVSAFRLYLVEQRNYSISVTSPRPSTIVGDRVAFDPKSACYADWYLEKTGSLGFRLADKESIEAYNKLLDFIAHSGKYKLILTERLPDQSDLLLYKRVSF